jgi:asparagine synthase (glutamine-hydrolysing)
VDKTPPRPSPKTGREKKHPAPALRLRGREKKQKFMCGIAAVIALNGNTVPPALCVRFDASLAHRGPDASGLATYRRDGSPAAAEAAEVALLHRRLSIIDLDPRANQPMPSPDGRYVLVFNGEIYNYVELREQLVRDGHVFRTTSDTEVLIAAYASWGEKALSRFVGMYAFALLDRERRELFLARDAFGIKPLFWARGSGHLALASEIGPLLDVPGVGRAIDQARTCLFLSVGQTDESERTMFANVRSLPAGTYARVPLDAPAVVPVAFWRPTVAVRDRSPKAAAQEVCDALVRSVELHLRSDVPTGISLSGGIDSSAIIACARAVGGSTVDLRTFSFTATGSEVDETPFIDMAARAAGAEQHVVRIEPAEIVADIDRLIAVQGEPFGSLSMYAQHRVMGLARDNGIKVILDGQGADELFAGYRPYLARRLTELLASFRLPEAIRFVRAMGRLPGAGARLVAQAFEPAVSPHLRGFARRIVGRPLLPPWIDGEWFTGKGEFATGRTLKSSPRLLHDALVQSLTETVLPALLRYGDRNSMAFSIESRVPFLTPALADLAYSLPADHLVSGAAVSKAVLRDAMRGLVPDAILDRRDKIAFSTPDRMWGEALRPFFERTLTCDVARALPWLDAEAALRALDRRIAQSAPFGFDLWRTVNVVRWIERFDAGFA